MKKVFYLSFLLCFSSSAFSLEDEYFECIKELEPDASLVEQVDNNFSKISSTKADFRQFSNVAGFDFSEETEGKLSFIKGGKMRWEYKEGQLFVSSGEDLSFYIPERNTVIISKLDQGTLSDVPVSFILGVGTLKEKFNLGSLCRTKKGLKISFTPKDPDPSLRLFRLVISEDSKLPFAAEVEDDGLNNTKLILEDIKYNLELSKELFEISVPDGADIIRQ